jgi:hypothetical protein
VGLRLLYIEYPCMIPSYMFWNSFCEWLGKTNLCQKKSLPLDSNCFGKHPLASAPKIEFVWPSLPPNHTIILSPICR